MIGSLLLERVFGLVIADLDIPTVRVLIAQMDIETGEREKQRERDRPGGERATGEKERDRGTERQRDRGREINKDRH